MTEAAKLRCGAAGVQLMPQEGQNMICKRYLMH